ncbi:intraflagellar transport protein 172 homolog [Neocloeon triangulifer]|uniref:intraflagellar transport protein 172 homolog n=1 Tax=Neocloeon triangulifer TaxID=2078957 RepID=UPI00286F464B|nr:intraflagellar transport protein 172 homolog [Neocloeon triangulifer]
MRIKYLKSFLPAQNHGSKITALAWSPNNIKLAACNSDRVILLFDDNGDKKDKFATKPADPKSGKSSYAVTGLAFSPDSTKIAVAQSDHMVYVYRIGEDWGEKKVICNKFSQSSAVTAIVWLSEGFLVCGLYDGKVRECVLKANKARTLYAGNSMVVALTPNTRGTGFLSGHIDGTIARYYMTEDAFMEQQGRIAQHSVPPYALAWPNTGHVIAAGCDKRIVVYEKEGQVAQSFDFSREPQEREFTVACNAPSGQAAAFGSYDKLRILYWDLRKNEWVYETKDVKNLYSVSALAWRRDGSKLACTGLCGSIEVFESVLKRTVWRNKFEMIYVAPSQVLVRPLHGDQPRGVILRSKYGHEISEVRIAGLNDQFLIARTSHSILLGDMTRNLLSEVPWVSPLGNEKFSFDNPTVCLVFHAGELSLVEYGNNSVLASVRTEFMNPHLISVRINERQMRDEENKKLAYLLDLKTVSIVDLISGSVVGQMSHDARINWLELSEPADKLLFRDSKLRLWLLPLANHPRAWHKIALLANCSFVQWVSGSDVVVAQSGSVLCVWYNLDSTDGATQVPIKGDVVEVTRDEGKTEVVVEEARGQKVAYALDEGMVEFGTALQDGNFERALKYLESLSPNDDAQETMWRSLAAMAQSGGQLKIAHRCYEHLGNKARAAYLEKTIKIAEEFAGKFGGDGLNCPEVQTRLLMLDKQFRAAEEVYLQSGDVSSAIRMYEQFCMYEEALDVAERYGSPEQGALRQKLDKWYLETMQEDKAGERKEQEGLYVEAVDLYLKAEMPKKASRTLLKETSLLQDEMLVGKVANALGKAGQMDLAGDLWSRVSRQDKALECYKKGGAFAKAVQICRDTRPNDVVKLEGEWAEYLMGQRQFDAAISHFIEAGHTAKALEAAIKAGQWKKAKQIIEVIEDKKGVKKYFNILGKHFAAEKDYRNAENMFLEGGAVTEAVEMYSNTAQWEKAWKVATKHMSKEEAAKVLNIPAEKMIGAGKFREAEKLLLVMGQAGRVVEMYREHKRYDEMCRVASTHLSVDECKQLQQVAAAELQASKAWRASEKLLCTAGDWKAAVAMYRAQGMWDEALRVAKSQGGTSAWRNIAFLWAMELGGQAAVKLLDRLALLDFAIEHACDNYQFEFAFDLSRQAQPAKMSDIHYKYALALEDDGKFQDAEEHFIKSGKPKEAVHMYVHGQNFEKALKIAEEFSPEDVNDVLEAQAKVALAHNDLSTFEALMIRAHRAEIVIQQYKENGNWMEALRVCREHLPAKLGTLEAQYKRETGHRGRGGGGEGATVLAEARKLEEAGQQQRAIDLLLRVSPKNCNDPTAIAKAWVRAVELVIKYAGEDEARKIAKNYGSQLVEIGQHAAAAQILLSADLVQEAVEVLMAAGEWNKARKIAQQLEPSLEKFVEKGYKSWLKSQGQTDQLADMDVAEAIEMLAQQEQWTKCKQVAQENGGLSTYLVLHASHLLKTGKPLEALEVYASNQPIPTLDSGTLSTVRMIALAILSLPNLSDAQSYEKWVSLRNILLQMSEDFYSTQKYPEIRTLLTLAHFCAIRSACRGVDGLESLAAKLSIALLRFTDVIPSDKAYFEAGMDAKALGWDSEAFVFLNRLLDVCEAIEEVESGGAPTLLDATDLQCTDFPVDAPLPRKMTISHQELEEAREWLLAVSMDQKIDQNLPLDFRGVYAACLQANEAEPPVEMCILSGWPVLDDSVQLGNNVAIKQEWNNFLLASRTSHAMPLDDVLKFLAKWCGKLPEGFQLGLK